MILRKPALVIFLQPIYIFIVGFPSLLLIEDGSYISEINSYGYQNYSLIYYSIFAFISLVIFYKYCDKIKVAIKNKSSLNLYLMASIPYVMIILYSIYNNQNLTRFNIFSVGPLLEKLFNYWSVIFIAIYYYCSLIEISKYKRVYYLIGALFIQWLMGSQFSGQIFVLFIYLNCQYLNNDFYISRIKSVLLSFLVLFCLLSFKNSFYENGYEQLINRVTLQSHLFWSVMDDNSSKSFIVFFEKFIHQITTIDIGPPSTSYGLGELMHAYSGRIAEQFLEDGVYFSGGYPSILVFYFGIGFAILLHTAITFLFVFAMKFLLQSIKYNVIIFILIYKLFALSIFSIFYSGEIFFISLKLIILSMLCFIFIILTKSKAEINNEKY